MYTMSIISQFETARSRVVGGLVLGAMSRLSTKFDLGAFRILYEMSLFDEEEHGMKNIERLVVDNRVDVVAHILSTPGLTYEDVESAIYYVVEHKRSDMFEMLLRNHNLIPEDRLEDVIGMTIEEDTLECFTAALRLRVDPREWVHYLGKCVWYNARQNIEFLLENAGDDDLFVRDSFILVVENEEYETMHFFLERAPYLRNMSREVYDSHGQLYNTYEQFLAQLTN